MKNIYKINYDGMDSTIEEVSPIHSWSGDKIVFDDYEYFSTKAKAKKYLIKDLTDRMNNLKWTIQNIKEKY